MTLSGKTLSDLAETLAMGRTSARALTESALEAIDADPRAFARVDAQGARAQADASDRLRAAGLIASPFAGVPISVKDLFDLAGQPTPAGSAILRDAPPAGSDAPVVARLRAAGFVILGRTQMSEFAFTGLGLNPHSPQPPNPRDPARAPGGSSGGAAVSVALGQAAGAIGTDTGGSVRIPAAYCGLTGFKPTQRRITRAGTFPLSRTLDSIGPIALSVACCRSLDAIMADRPAPPAPPLGIAGLRLGIPNHYLLEDLAPEIAAAWERTTANLARAGARLERFDFPELPRLREIHKAGAIPNVEAFALHRGMGLLDRGELYDPNVLARIRMGERLSGADYVDLLEARSDMIAAAARRTAPFDAVIAPTTPNLPPRLADVADPAAFTRQNALALRNTSVGNFLDRCALSLPMPVEGVPCGLMLMGETLGDARLLAVAQAVESALRPGAAGI